MGEEIDDQVFDSSQYAIRDYMNCKKGNNNMHKARVLVSLSGENVYNNILKVVPVIDTNYSSVDIIGDTQFERNYYTGYNNKYQKFTFINGALLITGKDRFGNSIEIDISSV